MQSPKHILTFAALTALTSTAHADEPRVAITFSPLHLIIPMAEVTAEVRASDRLGLAAIGGAGLFRDPDSNDKVRVLEAGASARYYVTGSFRTGVQVGAEILYVHASADEPETMIDVRAAGLGLSAFAGYKWTHRSGLTLEGQLGATYMAAHGESSTGATADADDVAPMLNLNVGYSL